MSTRRRKPGRQAPRVDRCEVCDQPATMELGAWLANGDSLSLYSCNRHELDVMSRILRRAS